MVGMLFSAISGFAQEWANPLYLSGGGVWVKRTSLMIENTGSIAATGETLNFKISSSPGKLPLVGIPLREIRVTNEKGQEYLFRVSVAGKTYQGENIPEGAELTVPVEAQAGERVRLFVYHGNPFARQIPAGLPKASTGFRDSMENGGDDPEGWFSLYTSATHRNSRSSSEKHSGQYSLHTAVTPGAPSSWVSWSRELPVMAGSVYRISGWVKGKSVQGGNAGFYVHIYGNGQTLVNRVEAPCSGTFDWRKVEFTITIPAGGHTLRTGTVMTGSGNAWFDDVEVKQLMSPLHGTVGTTETLTLASPPPIPWELSKTQFPSRIPLRCVNTTSESLRSTLYMIPLQRISHMIPTEESIRLMLDGKPVAVTRLDGQLLFMLDSIPPYSERKLHLYLAADARNVVPGTKIKLVSHSQSDYQLSDSMKIDLDFYDGLLASGANLLRNGSFEQGLDGWKETGKATKPGCVKTAVFAGGPFGKSAAQVMIPEDAPADWFGLRQNVRLLHGRSYLLAGWSRAQEVQDKNGKPVFQTESKRIFSHLYDRSMPKERLMRDTPGNYVPGQEWEFSSVTFRSLFPDPELEVHLTMKGTGSFEYDGILLAEIRDVLPLPMEHIADTDRQGVAVWQENPIRKVFRDSCKTTQKQPFSIEMARNESEGLQLAFRSNLPLAKLTLTATAPLCETGSVLTKPEIGVIGYVPVDSVSTYYKFKLKPWESPVPDGNTAGMEFPDPIIQGNQFSLEPLKTQCLWLGFETEADTPPGLYRGTIELRSEGHVLIRHPYEVLVRDIELGKSPQLPAVFDIRSGSRPDLRGYSVQELLRFMARKKICPDRVPAEPIFKLENGKVTADFTEYDRMAELYFNELKMPFSYFPAFFSGFGWGNVPDEKFGIHALDGGPYYENIDRSKLRPEYKSVYQQALRLYWKHVKTKGWADRLTVFISDEPYPEVSSQLGALCDMIHEVSPDIRIYSSTWWYKPELDGRLDYWGAGIHGSIPADILRSIKAEKGRFFFTTDGHLCLDTEYTATERMLPLFCWKYGAELYEFWGFDWLTRNPFAWGQHETIREAIAPGVTSFVRYPNGDGYLIYPGKAIGAKEKILSSIRLEAVRDGVEDFDYYRQLALLTEKSGDREGAEILAELQQLIAMPNLGGRNSVGILADPDHFSELRSRMATTIVRLSKELSESVSIVNSK